MNLPCQPTTPKTFCSEKIAAINHNPKNPWRGILCLHSFLMIESGGYRGMWGGILLNLVNASFMIFHHASPKSTIIIFLYFSCAAVLFFTHANCKNNLLEHAAHRTLVFKNMFCVPPPIRIRTSLFQSG